MGISKDGLGRLAGIRRCMIDRCYNPKNPGYSNYGGSGVRVCDDWYSSETMFVLWAMESGFDESLYGNDCTIDRIDPFGDYEPENCRWANASEQSENKRANVIHDLNEDFLYLEEAAKLYGVGIEWIERRANNGWIPYMQIGNRRLFSKAVLQKMEKQVKRKQDREKCKSPVGGYIRMDGKPSRKQHDWTSEEDENLLLCSVGKTTRQVAAEMDLNQSSIVQRVNALGYTWMQVKHGEVETDENGKPVIKPSIKKKCD